MIELTEKAAGMTTAEAAAVLARVAAAARPPLVKAAIDPDMLRRLAIGAGVGAGGMGLMGLMRGKRPKSVLRDALMGGALGAGGGLAYHYAPAIAATAGQRVTPPEQMRAQWDARYAPVKAVYRAMGWQPAEAPDRTALEELVGPVANAPGGGLVRDVVGSRVAAIGATAGNALHDANKALLRHRMRPIAETHAGLQDLLVGAKTVGERQRYQAQLGAIEQSFGRPGALSGLRPAAGYGFNAFREATGGGELLDAGRARHVGAALFRNTKDEALRAGHFGPLFQPRNKYVVGGRYFAPLLARMILGR